MFKLLGCARGHFWEAADADASPVCPVCGTPADTFTPDLAASDQPLPSPPPIESPPVPLLDARGYPVVSGYKIMEAEGRGPTGVLIFQARQVFVNRLVTLKVVVAQDDPGQLAWGALRGEAQALGRLQHPNIVTLLEAGERDRQLFFNVVEFVDGPTLADELDKKPLPPIQAAALIEILARAIAYAHSQDLVHRSLKPSSILLQPLPAPKGAKREVPPGACQLHKEWFVPRLTDFGLSRRTQEGETADIELQGAMPYYLAPEQAAGRLRDIGPATDVYALGVILYEMLTGRPPFRGSTPGATVAQIQHAELIPPTQVRRIPADMDAICRKALHHSPRRRYPSAAALAEELRRYRVGMPVQARAAGAVRNVALWMGRNRMAAGLIASVVLAFASLLSAFVYGAIKEDSVTAELRSTRDREASVRQQMERLENESRRPRNQGSRDRQRAESYRYALLFAKVEQAIDRNDLQGAQKALADCPHEKRPWEWLYRSAQASESSVRLRPLNGGSPVKAMAFSPDGSRLAVVGGYQDLTLGKPENKGTVRLFDVRSGNITIKSDLESTLLGVAFNPTGTEFAVTGSMRDFGNVWKGNVHVWSHSEGLFNRHDIYNLRAIGTGAAYSADGQRLFVRMCNGQVTAFVKNPRDPRGRPVQEDFVKLTNVVSPGTVVVLGDKLGIAWIGADSDVRTSPNVQEGHLLFAQDIHWQYGALAVSADGQRLAAAVQLAWPNERAGIRGLLAPFTDDAIVYSNPSAPITALAFGPDGTRLFSVSSDATMSVWDPLIGVELLRISLKDLLGKMPLEAPAAIAVSQDSKYVAFAIANDVYLIDPLFQNK